MCCPQANAHDTTGGEIPPAAFHSLAWCAARKALRSIRPTRSNPGRCVADGDRRKDVMATTQRKMPSRSAVLSHWLPVLIRLGVVARGQDAKSPKDNARPLGAQVVSMCWKCRRHDDGDLERCHIRARCNGGSDTADNLHLLCGTCHVMSEMLEGEEYWKWFTEK